MGVEASLRVQLGNAELDDEIANIELDDVLNVDDEGETVSSFHSEDSIYFGTHFSNGAQAGDIIATDGTIYELESVTRSAEESLLFSSKDPDDPTIHDLKYLPSDGIEIEYLGREGAITTSQKLNGILSLTGDVETVPFRVKIRYNYIIQSYRLQAPKVDLGEDETYDIDVVMYVESTGEENECKGSS